MNTVGQGLTVGSVLSTDLIDAFRWRGSVWMEALLARVQCAARFSVIC